MDIFWACIWIVIGFVCLVKGADWFVDGAAGIAEKMRIPQLVVGLTIVAFGTSAPELATSILSAVQGDPSIAVGNIIGSNITNILLILGLAACIAALPVNKAARRVDLPVLLFCTGLMVWMGVDGRIGRIDGVILTVIMIAYTWFLIWSGMREKRKNDMQERLLENAEQEPRTILEDAAPQKANALQKWIYKMRVHTWFLIVMTVVGLAIVVLGAQLAVNGATTVATELGVPERIIGLTVVAIGTSLPELVTCVTAAKKGETDIAVGDIVGSNIFNIIRTGGIAALICPLAFESAFLIDGLIALTAAALLATLGYIKGNKVTRVGGIIMLCGFVGYYVYLFATL